MNIAAIGELTALDHSFRRDYRHMLAAGLIEDIEDYEVLNFFRKDGELNVHSEYGYLMHDVTARQVCDWWKKKRAA